MKSKEQWITETMGSLEGIHRADSDPLIFSRIADSSRFPSKRTALPGNRLIWQIAAGLAFLVTLNIFSLVVYSRSTAAPQTTENIIVAEYFSYLDTIKY